MDGKTTCPPPLRGVAIPMRLTEGPDIHLLFSGNVHYSCDKVIGESKIGGFLTFDSDFLPSHHQYECIVQVRTATFDTLRVSGILFHFADVEIGRNGCDNANLTVVDGKLRQWTIHQDYITGTKQSFKRQSTYDLDLWLS